MLRVVVLQVFFFSFIAHSNVSLKEHRHSLAFTLHHGGSFDLIPTDPSEIAKSIFSLLQSSFKIIRKITLKITTLKKSENALEKYYKKIKELRQKLKEDPSQETLMELFGLLESPPEFESDPEPNALETDHSIRPQAIFSQWTVPGIRTAMNDGQPPNTGGVQVDQPSNNPSSNTLESPCLQGSSLDAQSTDPSGIITLSFAVSRRRDESDIESCCQSFEPVSLMASGEESKKDWAARAEQWDEMVKRDLNRIHLSNPAVLKLLYELFGGDPKKPDLRDKIFVDIGCGNGCWEETLRSLGAKPTGIDLPAMIRIAKKNVPETPSIEFMSGSASRLSGFDKAVAHAVLSNYVLQDCANVVACIGRMSEILLPGGVAIVVIPNIYMQLKDSDCLQNYCTPHEIKVFSLCGARVDPPITVYHRPPEFYQNAFTRAGLVVERIHSPTLSEEQRCSLDLDVVRALDTRYPLSTIYLLRKPGAASSLTASMDEKVPQSSFTRPPPDALSSPYFLPVSRDRGAASSLTASMDEKVPQISFIRPPPDALGLPYFLPASRDRASSQQPSPQVLALLRSQTSPKPDDHQTSLDSKSSRTPLIHLPKPPPKVQKLPPRDHKIDKANKK